VNSDLRALLIGVAGSAIAYYGIKLLERYLARRTIRGRERQIKQLTAEIELLGTLGVADRELLLFAFQMLFGLIGVAAFGWTAALVRPFLRAVPGDPVPVIQLVIAAPIAVLAVYASSLFRKLEAPEPTLAKLRQKLRELQGEQGNPKKGG
jgi:hypothetical protein